MSRYIDADMLEKDRWNIQRVRMVSQAEMVFEAKKPTDFPAADVAEVRHGRWINHGSFEVCSVCGEEQYGHDSGRYYCPNCGSRMDLDGDEE